MPAISKDILPVAAIFAATFVVGYAATGRARRSANVPPPFPGAIVVAELFVSEDCSGCPAAERVLAQIVDQSVVPDVELARRPISESALLSECGDQIEVHDVLPRCI
jgi:hypothetical protein